MTLQLLEEKRASVMNYWKNRQKARQDKLLKEQNYYEFMQQLTQAKQNLQIARSNFNATTDDLLMEYYIYMIKAEETKLNYYLALAKKEHLQFFGDIAQNVCADSRGGI